MPAGAAGSRLFLRPSVEPFVDRHGELFLLRPGDADLQVRDAEPADHALLDALAERPCARHELLEQLAIGPAQLDAKVASLLAAGVVVALPGAAPALDARDGERFDRQLRYLAEAGDPAAQQRSLRGATVVMLGCGGLGTWALAALASAGIGRFVLVDDDVVELSNLNRQILYGEADVGTPKVDAAAAWLARFDTRIDVRRVRRRVSGPEAMAELVTGATVLVVAADWPPYTLARWANAACIAVRVPFVLAGQAPPILKVGPIYLPGVTACFACHERALRAAFPHYDDYVAHAPRSVPRSATLGPASGLVGTALAMELLHLIAGRRPAILGAVVTTDLRTLTTEYEAVPRAADCQACQHLGR